MTMENSSDEKLFPLSGGHEKNQVKPKSNEASYLVFFQSCHPKSQIGKLEITAARFQKNWTYHITPRPSIVTNSRTINWFGFFQLIGFSFFDPKKPSQSFQLHSCAMKIGPPTLGFPGAPADCPVAHDASPRFAHAAASAAVDLPPGGFWPDSKRSASLTTILIESILI